MLFLFYQALNPVDFTLHVQIAFYGVVISMSIVFLKPLQCYRALFHVCATQWPVWDLDGSLSRSSVLEVYSLLFWVIPTFVKLVGEHRNS